MQDMTNLTPETAAQLLDERRLPRLRELTDETQAEDLADIVEELEPTHAIRFFRLLNKELAAQVFAELNPDAQEKLITAFSDRELKTILDEMFYDDTVDMIEEMPASVVRRIIANSRPDDRKVINELLRYPSDSAGGVMTTEFVSLRADQTVSQALAVIRRDGINKETIYTCYVITPTRKLLGIVEAKDLLLSDGDTLISEVMEENVIVAHTLDDQEDVANRMSKYSLIALPVLDKEDRLVGIVTFDDAMDILHNEAEEDFSKMAGMSTAETPYNKTSVFTIWKNRFPWLAILMVSATFTGIIISSFETALAVIPILTAFIPMLMDTGGNSGSQASVTVIRGISLGELRLRDWYRVVWKELRVSLLCGISLSVLAFGKVMLVDRLIMQNPDVTVTVAFVVSVTLCLIVICAKLIGCTLPLLAERVGLDPAVMASPFITTMVDAIALLLYFGIARSLIPQLG